MVTSNVNGQTISCFQFTDFYSNLPFQFDSLDPLFFVGQDDTTDSTAQHSALFEMPLTSTNYANPGCSMEGDHRPIICVVAKFWLKKCRDDSETANWIKTNTKECGKCQSTIEKNGGCKYVVLITFSIRSLYKIEVI